MADIVLDSGGRLASPPAWAPPRTPLRQPVPPSFAWMLS